MSYEKQNWDANSYVNPSRMNHIEDGIADLNSDLSEFKNHFKYDEVTTRDGNSAFGNVNSSFLQNGYMSISQIGKQVTICVTGISSKTGKDWIIQLWSEYRPHLNVEFKYLLARNENDGVVQTDGLVYFRNLNNSEVISATITYNIA